MKRLIALVLVLVVLAGCTVQEPDPTTQPTQTQPQPTTEPTQPPGASLYVQDSALEQQTGGAIKVFTAPSNCSAVYPIGDALLLFYNEEPGQIHIYAGEELWLQYAVSLDAAVAPGDLGVQISANGMSYYDADTRQVVLLDEALKEIKRVTIPENAQGIPVVDPQQKKAYFCTENEIRVLNLETGIASLLRQEVVTWQSVYDICFDGAVLLCDVIDEDQNGYLAFIDTTNGKLLGKDTAGWNFDSAGDSFLLTNTGETLYGTWDSEVVNFVPAGADAKVWPALPLGGAVVVYNGDTGLALDLYTLESGLRTGSVTLPKGTDAYGFVPDESNGCIWFLLEDTSAGTQTLCRWDYTMTAVADETVYTQPRYTESSPDTEGLAQCQTLAQSLGTAWSMDIRIWNDAAAAPWEGMKAEYRPSAFREALSAMEQTLSAFAEGMVNKLATLSKNRVTTVSLVQGSGEAAQSRLEWVDGSIYIAVEMGSNFSGAFCNALYRAMDTYILNSNSMLDEWDSRDPVGDRAMIFEYAMSADKGDYFEGRDAQSKLKQLCKAIRDAFGLKKYEGTLPWEQHLGE